MKFSIIPIFILVFSFFARADIAENLNQECKTNPEVLRQLGPNGNCRVVLAPKPALTKGACQAKSGEITCQAVYVSEKAGSAMKLTCFADPSNPFINEMFPINAVTMNAAYIISRSDGSFGVVNDSRQFLTLSSDLVKVNIIEDNSGSNMTGQIIILTEQGPVGFDNAVCTRI